jgi:hypothetical protein
MALLFYGEKYKKPHQTVRIVLQIMPEEGNQRTCQAFQAHYECRYPHSKEYCE